MLKINGVFSASLTPVKKDLTINQDLYLPDETLIAPKGTIVEEHFMRIIDNYYATYHNGNPFPQKVQVILRKKK